MIKPLVLPNKPLGIDVSNWQGLPNWTEVKDNGVKFAMSKATEGITYRDTSFKYNWQMKKANGIIRDAYHFARPSVNDDPTQEVYFFADAIDKAGGLEEGDLITLDIEDEQFNNDASGWTLFWCEIAENMFGFKPKVYTGKWYIDSRQLNNAPKLGTYPLHIAAYQSTMPIAQAPWNLVSFWQYTDKGSVPGISGYVDLDVFNGALENIVKLGKQKTPQPPTTSEIDVVGIEAALVAIENEISLIRNKLRP